MRLSNDSSNLIWQNLPFPRFSFGWPTRLCLVVYQRKAGHAEAADPICRKEHFLVSLLQYWNKDIAYPIFVFWHPSVSVWLTHFPLCCRLFHRTGWKEANKKKLKLIHMLFRMNIIIIYFFYLTNHYAFGVWQGPRLQSMLAFLSILFSMLWQNLCVALGYLLYKTNAIATIANSVKIFESKRIKTNQALEALTL